MPRHTTHKTCAETIVAAYTRMAPAPNAWVRIADLRRAIEWSRWANRNGWNADTVERTLVALADNRGPDFAVHLAPDEQQGSLTADDRRYAVKPTPRGKPCHLIAINI